MTWHQFVSWLYTVHKWGDHGDLRFFPAIIGTTAVLFALYFAAKWLLLATVYGFERVRRRVERCCRVCQVREQQLLEIREAHLDAREALLAACMDATASMYRTALTSREVNP